ncbi:putative non-specific serine/threonine protein kinase [Helianthus annuus]|uniref:non-specific serine/threonine protein kinase n=1 Tax=Helianthus annuus TaxID=4232 RepID=A0A9K3DS78_HELAN|nr:putative non-specific serine/threonine protein kinase [Helianthus annuus]KAJ0437477.1 putative non-specific serine/threonine protein kinase [Helianthus annuus]KAJ0459795.1 putative non-specific serine/threonine protein kinase [Helianthus annuus]
MLKRPSKIYEVNLAHKAEGGSSCEAFLKFVEDCSVVIPNPSRKDAISESPLKIALFALYKLCTHAPCRQFLRASDRCPVLGKHFESGDDTISEYASVILKKTAQP